MTARLCISLVSNEWDKRDPWLYLLDNVNTYQNRDQPHVSFLNGKKCHGSENSRLNLVKGRVHGFPANPSADICLCDSERKAHVGNSQ